MVAKIFNLFNRPQPSFHEKLLDQYNAPIDAITQKLTAYFTNESQERFFTRELEDIYAAKIWISQNFLSDARKYLEQRPHVARQNFYSRDHIDVLLSYTVADRIDALTDDQKLTVANTRKLLHTDYEACLRYATGLKASMRHIVHKAETRDDINLAELNAKAISDRRHLKEKAKLAITNLNNNIDRLYSDFEILKDSYVKAINDTIEPLNGFFNAAHKRDIKSMQDNLHQLPKTKATAHLFLEKFYEHYTQNPDFQTLFKQELSALDKHDVVVNYVTLYAKAIGLDLVEFLAYRAPYKPAQNSPQKNQVEQPPQP